MFGPLSIGPASSKAKFSRLPIETIPTLVPPLKSDSDNRSILPAPDSWSRRLRLYRRASPPKPSRRAKSATISACSIARRAACRSVGVRSAASDASTRAWSAAAKSSVISVFTTVVDVSGQHGLHSLRVDRAGTARACRHNPDQTDEQLVRAAIDRSGCGWLATFHQTIGDPLDLSCEEGSPVRIDPVELVKDLQRYQPVEMGP